MNRLPLFENFNTDRLSSIRKLKSVDGGTEGAELYMDDQFFYKIQVVADVYLPRAKQILDYAIKADAVHYAKIYEYWQEDGYFIVKMERLYPHGIKKYDYDAAQIDHIYYESEDELDQLKAALDDITDPVLLEVFGAIVDGMEELGIDHYDMGLHNIMVDKRGNYKIIDFW
jgi:hypothetical protein